MFCDLVRVTTRDGVRLDGALVPPDPVTRSNGFGSRSDEKNPNAVNIVGKGTATVDFDAIIAVHGVASNFYSSNLFENLTPRLQSLGVPLLLVNTRGHDLACYSYANKTRRTIGAAFEIVDECRLDLSAWIDWLVENGKRQILLLGHSLGAIKIVHAASVDQRPELQGVIAMSAPRLASSAFRHGSESGPYLESLLRATELVKKGEPDTLMQSSFPYPLLITAGGYLDKYGPGDRYNIIEQIPKLQCPSLFTYGQLELDSGATAFAGIDYAIQQAKRTDQSIKVAVIPDADHNYSGQSAALATQTLDWIRSTFATEIS